MGMLKEFKDFAMRGNVVDMAVGVVIGAAFGKIVTSLVSDVMMPVIGKLTGGVNVSDTLYALDGKTYPGLKAAKDAGGNVLAYGNFIQTIIDFTIVAFAIFLMVKLMNTVKSRFEKEKAATPPAAPAEDIVLLREIRDALRR
jgi:large conductance mechanosensitive channel